MASKLIITRGLPGSGKSTWAENIRKMSSLVRVVTMDDIRAAIGAEFEAGDESIVQGIRNYTIREYLKKGYTVISADTNLSPYSFAKVKSIAEWLTTEGTPVDVEIKDFTDVPLETCLERNRERHARGDFKVPHEAIVAMHDKFIKKS